MRNLGLNFEKKTVYLNYNFPIYWSAIYYTRKDTMTSVSSVNYAKHEFENLKAQNARAAY